MHLVLNKIRRLGTGTETGTGTGTGVFLEGSRVRQVEGAGSWRAGMRLSITGKLGNLKQQPVCC